MTAPREAVGVRHPVWCVNAPQDAPYAAPGSYAKLAPAEADEEHVGRRYSLDAGDTFAWSVTLGLQQMFTDLPEDTLPIHVRVSVQDHEGSGTETSAYLTLAELDTLAAMIQRVRSDAEMSA